jgi:hypothetical protein
MSRSPAPYQFSRGVQTGGAGPSIQALWPVLNAVANPQIGRNWTGTASRTIQLIREGLEYGDDNLSQLDLRASKRVGFGRYRLRMDFDVYNVFNSSWAVHGQLDLLHVGHKRVAASDQRAAEPLLQAGAQLSF